MEQFLFLHRSSAYVKTYFFNSFLNSPITCYFVREENVPQHTGKDQKQRGSQKLNKGLLSDPIALSVYFLSTEGQSLSRTMAPASDPPI